MHNCPLLTSKQTSARIDFLRQGGRLVAEKGTHNVKFVAEKLTKAIIPCTHVWATARKVRTLTTACTSGGRACSPRPTETASWKRRSHLSLTGCFQLVENALNNLPLTLF